ncbi:hypothetical protein [Sinomicrobium weinanense]|uniref:Uncharacterized protein n=1 Tax=Sinomicrobium weinanense TaxID=2842200 RepID=A0A926JU43_9FLAO|nr:hypothetical protein [Sinomicrobium weinanense]MBC9797226.1 hypothetical protein [Sinomicrobium weinanense]MBU3125561.1 hypothetical protein [Sinomicrobium weinanense]
MNRSLKIMLAVGVIVLFVIGWNVYTFLGNPYWKIGLLGTKYIKETDYPDKWEADISVLNEVYEEDFYVVRKYKYSKYVWGIGYGGSSSHTDDYFAYGLADAGKNIIIPVKYEYLQVGKDDKTNKLYALCKPYRKKGNGEAKKEIYDFVKRGNSIRVLKRNVLNNE